VAKLGVPAGTPVGREMLRVEVIRVADRHAATMAEEADRIRDAEGGARQAISRQAGSSARAARL